MPRRAGAAPGSAALPLRQLLTFVCCKKTPNSLDGILGRALDPKKLPILPIYRQTDSLGELLVEGVEWIGIIFGPRRGHEVENDVQAAIRHHADLRFAIGIEARERNHVNRFIHSITRQAAERPAQLPGPLAEQDTSEHRYAAPVSCSALVRPLEAPPGPARATWTGPPDTPRYGSHRCPRWPAVADPWGSRTAPPGTPAGSGRKTTSVKAYHAGACGWEVLCR